MNMCMPIRALTEGTPKLGSTEVSSQTKTANFKAACGLLQTRLMISAYHHSCCTDQFEAPISIQLRNHYNERRQQGSYDK